jgi:hypothetical protein
MAPAGGVQDPSPPASASAGDGELGPELPPTCLLCCDPLLGATYTTFCFFFEGTALQGEANQPPKAPLASSRLVPRPTLSTSLAGSAFGWQAAAARLQALTTLRGPVSSAGVRSRPWSPLHPAHPPLPSPAPRPPLSLPLFSNLPPFLQKPHVDPSSFLYFEAQTSANCGVSALNLALGFFLGYAAVTPAQMQAFRSDPGTAQEAFAVSDGVETCALSAEDLAHRPSGDSTVSLLSAWLDRHCGFFLGAVPTRWATHAWGPPAAP